uniref:Uncharacterized protein n=1 Tax=Tetraodon nigroviridis TaxID=99883 RepID=H3BX19_TETNG
MSVPLRLCFAVLFLAAVEAHEGKSAGNVRFWSKDFTMTCPDVGKWFQESKEMGPDGTESLTLEYKDKGKYHCEYDDAQYYFYVRGKVCENCFELDASLYAAIIAGDMGLTLVVMAIVYKCTKKRRSAGLPHPPKAGGRAPPVPSPDYERLNPHTLSQGTYSEVHTSRMD